MHDARHQDDEDRLRDLFARGLDAPADDGFTDAVMRRIQRRLRTRKTVLTIATVTGGLLALGPAYDLSLAFSNIDRPGHGRMGWDRLAAAVSGSGHGGADRNSRAGGDGDPRRLASLAGRAERDQLGGRIRIAVADERCRLRRRDA